MSTQSFRVRYAPHIALTLSLAMIGLGVHDVVGGDGRGWVSVGVGVVVGLTMAGVLLYLRHRERTGQGPPVPGQQSPGQRVATGVFSLVFFGVAGAMFASGDLMDTTRRGLPVWLVAGALVVSGVMLVVIAVRGPRRGPTGRRRDRAHPARR